MKKNAGFGLFVCYRKDIPAYTLIATTPSSDSPTDVSYSSSSALGAEPESSSSRKPGSLVFTALILTLIRLEKVDTDVVITINVPHIRGEYDERDVDIEQGRQGKLIGLAVEHAHRVWETFKIKNLGLFGSQYDGVRDYDEL